jgi:TldD protein
MMKPRCISLLLCLVLSASVWAADKKKPTPPPAPAAAQAKPPGAVLLSVMEQELGRAIRELAKTDPAPYFISYAATDHSSVAINASHGALFNTSAKHTRTADVTLRVATPALDNTHDDNRPSGMMTALLPLQDDPDAIARVLWQTTDKQYKRAARTFLQVKTNTAVRAKEEDDSADFSKEAPQVHPAVPEAPPAHVDIHAWEEKLRQYSAVFRKYPDVYRSTVTLTVDDVTRYFVSSEGSKVVTHKPMARLIVYAETRADDGMDLLRSETFEGATPDRLPADAEIIAKIETVATDLQKLRTAPLVEPFNGPAMLSGRAAAVFFHEVLGHRVEGHRQKGIQEGQTFTKKLNQQVLPTFLSVVDDPTVKQLNGVELSGSYEYDDEGVASRRVDVIHDGILQQFLMARMPIHGFDNSNGHGRGQEGMMPVGRQGNLIVTSSRTVPDADLRKLLVEEIKKLGKPYGLYFVDIAGGFTLTTRALPQAFQVLPVMVYRVYADGRPDELVRGVDIVGTPLAALTRIAATGNTTQVFNGVCGAESGAVPVAAAAPAMLFSEIEVQKRRQTQDRPPILSAPGAGSKTAEKPIEKPTPASPTSGPQSGVQQ